MALKNVAKQDIPFTGSVDTGTDIKDIKPGDYIDAVNIRNVFTDQQDNRIINVDSNQLVTFTLPSGTNKCTGKYEDQVNRRLFYFIWNNGGNHRLLMYLPAQNGLGTIRVILSGSILALTEWDYISHVSLVRGTNGDLLYWTDGVNPQRKINISKADNFQKHVIFKICFALPTGSSEQFQYEFADPNGGSTTTTLTFPNTLVTRADASEYAYSQFILIPYLTTNFTIINAGEYVEFTSIVQTGIWTITLTQLGNMAGWYKAMNWYPTVTLKTLDVVGWPNWRSPEISLGFNADVSTNYLNNYAYQFRVQVFYEDGEESSLSIDSRWMLNETMLPAARSGGYVQFYTGAFDIYSSIFYSNTSPYTVSPTETQENNYINITYSDDGGSGSRLFTNRDLIKGVKLFVRNLDTAVFSEFTYLADYELDGLYKFYNNETKVTISEALNAKPYNAVPLISGSQEVVNEKLFYAKNTVGYDNVQIDMRMEVTPKVLVTDADFMNNGYYQLAFPKRCGEYLFSIIYYDRFNRTSLVSPNFVKINLPAQDVVVLADRHKNNVVSFEIYSQPPIWATHYSIVRTREITRANYIQYEKGTTIDYLDAAGNTVAFGSGQVRFAAMEKPAGYPIALTDYYVPIYLRNINCRIVKTDYTATFGPAFVVEYDKVNDPTLPDLNQCLINEVFTPRTISENELYYEIGNDFDILNPGTSNRSHQGGTKGGDQDYLSSIPATGIVYYGWDTYFDFNTSFSFNESLYPNNNGVTINGTGRAFAIIPENKQITIGENIAFSDVFNAGSQYNGFGTWELLNNKNIPVGFGSVNLLKSMDNILVCVCTNKSFSIYVDKAVIQGQDGSPVISLADQVIGSIRDLNGLHGTVNPESFAINEGLLFWWDVYRGEICQYSIAGIDAVSNYKMTNYFAQKGRDGVKAFSQQYKVLGVIDKPHKEYIISFPPTNVDSSTQAAVTWAYNYIANGWKTRYSFIPEMMCAIDNNFATFKNGALWLHKPNASKNRFYDVQYAMEITFVVNAFPDSDKTFQGLSVETRKPPNFPTILTPVTDWNPNGQVSELLETDFELMNNSYWASFFMNKNTPNFATPTEALINGEVLSGQTMTLVYSKLSSDPQWVKAVHVHFVSNELTN